MKSPFLARVSGLHRWPGNTRELENVAQNIVTFTLFAAADAIRDGVPMSGTRLQVDPGLIGELLAGSAGLSEGTAEQNSAMKSPNQMLVELRPGATLNAVSSDVEKQYFLELYRQTEGDFNAMADRLLGDEKKGRAVRLRFNQLGLKVRELDKR